MKVLVRSPDAVTVLMALGGRREEVEAEEEWGKMESRCWC